MTCPVCGGETKVIDSRAPDCEHVRRRRECVECKYRFFTVEYEEELADEHTRKGLGEETPVEHRETERLLSKMGMPWMGRRA